jgi:hypothetical protein
MRLGFLSFLGPADPNYQTSLDAAKKKLGIPTVVLAQAALKTNVDGNAEAYKKELEKLIRDSDAPGVAETELMVAYLAAHHEDIRMNDALEFSAGIGISEERSIPYYDKVKHFVVKVSDNFEVLSKVDAAQDPNLARMREAYENIRKKTPFKTQGYSCKQGKDCMYKAVAAARKASNQTEPIEDSEIAELKRHFKEYITNLTLDTAKIGSQGANALEKEFAKSKTDSNEPDMKVFIEEHDANQHHNLFNNAVKKYGQPRVLLAVAANDADIDGRAAGYKEALGQLIDNGDPPGDAEIILMNAFLAKEKLPFLVGNANVIANRVAIPDLPVNKIEYLVVGVGNGFEVLHRDPAFVEGQENRGKDDSRPKSAPHSTVHLESDNALLATNRPGTARGPGGPEDDRLTPLSLPNAAGPEDPTTRPGSEASSPRPGRASPASAIPASAPTDGTTPEEPAGELAPLNAGTTPEDPADGPHREPLADSR